MLEEADLRRNEFLAMLAHELRNPLAPIRNALSVMRMSGVNESALSWARTVLDRQVAHLSRLVDDLLDVSRIAIGKITLQREPLEIAQIVTSAVESSQPLIDSRGTYPRGPAPGRAAAGRRRPDPALAGRAEPAQQRGQVHAQGRAHPADGGEGRGDGGDPGP